MAITQSIIGWMDSHGLLAAASIIIAAAVLRRVNYLLTHSIEMLATSAERSLSCTLQYLSTAIIPLGPGQCQFSGRSVGRSRASLV